MLNKKIPMLLVCLMLFMVLLASPVSAFYIDDLEVTNRVNPQGTPGVKVPCIVLTPDMPVTLPNTPIVITIFDRAGYDDYINNIGVWTEYSYEHVRDNPEYYENGTLIYNTASIMWEVGAPETVVWLDQPNMLVEGDYNVIAYDKQNGTGAMIREPYSVDDQGKIFEISHSVNIAGQSTVSQPYSDTYTGSNYTITNSGNQDNQPITLSLGGTDGASFDVNPSTLTLNAGASQNVTVKPKDTADLDVDSYDVKLTATNTTPGATDNTDDMDITYTITKKTLTMDYTSAQVSVTYNNNAAFTGTVESGDVFNATLGTHIKINPTSVVGTDDVSLTGTPTATFANKNAAAETNRAVTFSGISLSGADADNYQLPATLSANVGEIKKRALTVTPAAGVTKVYGTTKAAADLFASATGFAPGEDGDSVGKGNLLTSGGLAAAANVGTYTITAASTTNYNVQLAAGSYNMEVTEANVSAILSVPSVVYGTNASATATVTTPSTGTTVTYRVVAYNTTTADTTYATIHANTGAITPVKPTPNATTVEVEATVSAGGNYNNLVLKQPLSISKKELTLNTNSISAMATESPLDLTTKIQIPDAQVSGLQAAPALAFAVADAGTTSLVISGNNATFDSTGEATINVTFAAASDYYDLKTTDNANVVTLSVTSKPALIVNWSGLTKTYDGQPIAPTFTVDSSQVGQYVAADWELEFNDGSGIASAPTDVTSTYSVRVVPKNAATVPFSASTSANIAINGAKLTYSGTATKTYDKTNTLAFADIGGSKQMTGVNGETFTLTDITATYSTANAHSTPAAATVTAFTATADGAAQAGNYTMTDVSGIAIQGTIGKADLTVQGTPVAKKAYDGTAVVALGDFGTPAPTLNGVGGDTFALAGITATYSQASVHTAAAIDIDRITITPADTNYDLANVTGTINGEIGKAKLTVDVKTPAPSFNGTTAGIDPTLEQLLTTTGLISPDTLTSIIGATPDVVTEKKYTLGGDDKAVPLKDAGTYDFGVKIDRAAFNAIPDCNYELDNDIDLTGTFTIKKQPSGPGPMPTGYTVTYDAGEYGTIDGSKTESVEAGAKPANVPTVKAKDGYTFLGWSLKDKQVDPTTVEINEDTTFVALYAEVKEHKAFMQGYPEGDFRPDASISRAEVVAIFARILDDGSLETTAPETDFSDVDPEEWYAHYIAYLEEYKIILGYEDGSFRPNNPITRGEFAAIAARYGELEESEQDAFSDVPNDHWARGFINAVAAKGWVLGDAGTGNFRPDSSITRAEVATIVDRILERMAHQEGIEGLSIKTFEDVDTEHWAYYYVVEATNDHQYIAKDDKEFWQK